MKGGRLAQARKLWLPAHLDYARLGVAYGTFGKFNDEINGRPLGLVGGVHDPHFQGFLRLEYGLWHGQSRSELDPVATTLDERSTPSRGNFGRSDAELDEHRSPAAGARDLENTLQFELTGETNEGSNTNLATAWANIQGERLLLSTP